MADARTVQAGSIIDGRYQLTHRIAVGGMGEVWSSTDLALGRSVALKVLLAGHAQDEVTRLRFRAEAKAAASVSHPNVVPVFDFGEEDDESGGCIAYLRSEERTSELQSLMRISYAVFCWKKKKTKTKQKER